MISGCQHVDIMLGFTGLSEMSVLSQVSFLNEIFEKSKGKNAYISESYGLKTVEVLVRN